MTDTAPRVLVTAGPTAEDIDPVRFLTNRSSGAMGIEIAKAVAKTGGTTRLILGPTHLEPPKEVKTIRVRSAADMHRAVTENLGWAQSLVMAAAVADYTPAEPLDSKLKKKDGDLLLRLKRTVDILAAIADNPERKGKFIAGFSLDVGVDLNEGRRKLETKNLDLIVVNSVESFGSSHETALIAGRDFVEDCGRIGKEDLAERIVSRILAFLSQSEGK